MADVRASGSFIAPPHSETDPRSPHHGYTKAVQRLRDQVGDGFDPANVVREADTVHPQNETRMLVNLVYKTKAAKKKSTKKKAAAK